MDSVDELRLEHDRMQAEVERMAELADALRRDEGFDELKWLATLLDGQIIHHYPAEEKRARAVLGEDDPLVDELMLRHKALVTHFRTLLAMIQDVSDDVLVDRDDFDKTLRGVVTQMKAHLDFETRVLLPRLAG